MESLAASMVNDVVVYQEPEDEEDEDDEGTLVGDQEN